MRILTPDLDLDRFYGRLSRADFRLLLLDYDGTLAPFRTDRDRAVPFPGVREFIDGSSDLPRARIVIITGRSIGDFLPLLGLDAHPEIWGCHGSERITREGRYSLLPAAASIEPALRRAHEWCRKRGYEDRCERKTVCLAFHWRGLEKTVIDDLAREIEEGWRSIAAESGLVMHRFDGGVELRPPGVDKGTAVRSILGESKDGTVAVYLGDDRTDEDAFGMLGDSHLGVLVNRTLRPTAADIWIRPPDELLSFLHSWNEVIRGEPR